MKVGQITKEGDGCFVFDKFAQERKDLKVLLAAREVLERRGIGVPVLNNQIQGLQSQLLAALERSRAALGATRE